MPACPAHVGSLCAPVRQPFPHAAPHLPPPLPPSPPAAVLFSSIREECERMGVNERVLISDEAGRQFFVPPLPAADGQ